jgi:hypothetical protein
MDGLKGMVVAICKVVRVSVVGINCIIYGKGDVDDERVSRISFGNCYVHAGITLVTLYLRRKEIRLMMLKVCSFLTAIS